MEHSLLGHLAHGLTVNFLFQVERWRFRDTTVQLKYNVNHVRNVRSSNKHILKR